MSGPRPTVNPTSSAILGGGRRSQFLRIAEANASETRYPIRVTVHSKWFHIQQKHPTMEQEVTSVGHDVQVIDPDVRMHVYSLVTAVCDFLLIMDSTKR